MTDQIADALQLLGAAYRGDWSNFDGRTLRLELDGLSEYLRDPSKPFDLIAWAHNEGICPVSRCWHEHCPDKGSDSTLCAHSDAWYDEWISKEKP